MVKERTIVIKDVFRRGDNKIKDFNGYHAIAYAGSQLFYNPIRGNMWFSTNQLFQIMGNNDSRAKSKINSAIRDLIKWDMLEAENFNGKNGNNDVLSLKIPHIDKKESKFTTINYDFVLRIIESDQPITEKGNMLLIYMVLAQYMGNDVIAYPSIETMANDSGLSSSTISNTLHNLKELKIIEYGNNNTYNGCLVGNIYIFCDTPNHSDIFQSEMSQLTSAEVNKERWLNIDCSVYVVRLYNEYENFYKIGISVDVPRRLNQIPYKHEIIDVTETNMYEAYYLENELHQKYKQYRYFPAKDFDGKTECFHYIY